MLLESSLPRLLQLIRPFQIGLLQRLIRLFNARLASGDDRLEGCPHGRRVGEVDHDEDRGERQHGWLDGDVYERGESSATAELPDVSDLFALI